MWIDRTPEEEAAWHKSSQEEASSHGRFAGWLVFLAVTVLASGGWLFSLRAGVIVQTGSDGLLQKLSLVKRVPIVAAFVAPFAWWIYRRETRSELRKIMARTICPDCEQAASGNTGMACDCGGVFISASKVRWVDDELPSKS